jgi:undecaprenyl-diphosphatase
MVLVFLCVTAFCAFAFYFVDVHVANIAKPVPGKLLDVFQVITSFGRSTWYLVVSGVLCILFRFVLRNDLYAGRALLVFLSVSVSGLVTDGLKTVFGRCRPKMLYHEGLYGLNPFQFLTTYEFNSFPSGHATTVGALAAALWIISPKYGMAGSVLALLVMASRIIVGAHFVSDVVFGAYVGVMTALFFKVILERKGVAFRSRDS